MKTKLFIALCLLLSVGWMAGGCTDEKTVDSSKEITLEFDSDANLAPVINTEGGISTLSFVASSDWTAEVTAGTRSVDWLTVSPTAGKAGEVTLQINAQPNTSYDERNAAVRLSSGSYEKVITVTQKQLDALIVSSNKVEMEASGGAFGLELQANVDVSYEIEPEARSPHTWTEHFYA